MTNHNRPLCLLVAVASLLVALPSAYAARQETKPPVSGNPSAKVSLDDPCRALSSLAVEKETKAASGSIPSDLNANSSIPMSMELSAGKTVQAICFDAVSVPVPENVKGDFKKGDFNVQIPDNASGDLLRSKSHTVSIILEGAKDKEGKGQQSVIAVPVKTQTKLTSVQARPPEPGDPSFRVRFIGEGFDAENKTNNRILLVLKSGDLVDQNLCWTDASCALVGSKVVGKSVTPTSIEVAGLNSMDERTLSFKVCVSDNCSLAIDDQSAWNLWVAPSVALFTALFLVAAVVVLAWQLHPTEIDGKQYILTALFLDRETDTYSLSKLQFYVWTFVALFGYADLFIARWWYQHVSDLPPIPSGLPGIVAIAAGTSIGAQVITTMNGPKGAGRTRPSIADFITSGDVVAAERVQFFVWTFIGAIAFFLMVFVDDPRTMTSLPEVPWSLLSISGLSAFGYLGGKLARNAGPVINEITARKGPDPAPPAPDPTAAQPPAALATPPADVTAARAALTVAKTSLGQIKHSTAIQTVLDQATKACDFAEKALNAAAAGQAIEFKKFADDANTSATAAAAAVQQLAATTPDRDAAITAASLAQTATSKAQSVAVAPSAPAGTPPAPPAPASFGLLEIRGRILSRDATFAVSRQAETGGDDISITFDLLQPDPNDPAKIRRPRVGEVDLDAKDPVLAKRLMLVVNLADPNVATLFTPASEHTLTITNPDSQRAVLKFKVS